MHAVVARLFLEKGTELKVRSALKNLKVPTIEKGQLPNSSQVVNVFDQNSYRELVNAKLPGIKKAILIADENAISQDLDDLYYSLKEKGIQLLGILNPSKSDWQILFKSWLFGH